MSATRSLTKLALSALLTMAACGDDGGDGGGDHEFDRFVECYEHEKEHDLADAAAMEECDAVFELDHADAAACHDEHEDDVADGVPQSAVDAHCGVSA